MKNKNFARTLCILTSALIFVFIPSFGTHAKDITIKLGAILDLSGPLGADGRKGVSVLSWYQEYLNVEKGGWKDIEGNRVKLEVLKGDSEFNPAKAMALYKKFKDEGMVAVTCIGSVEMAAIRSACLKDRIPLPGNSATLFYPLPSPGFSRWADYSAVSVAMVDYVKQKWDESKAPWTKKRPPRLALIGPEAYPSWEASISPEVIRYAKLQGVEVVGKFYFPMRPIDTKPQILAAKRAGCDFIYMGIVTAQGGAVLRDLYDLGLKGDPTKEEGKIELIGMFPMSPKELVEMAGGREEAVKGMVIVGCHADPWEDQPALRLTRKYAEKYKEIEKYDQNYVIWWYAAMTIDRAIELALQKVPGDKLKGSDVWEGFLSIKDLDMGGIIPNKLTYSEEKRLGMEKIRIDRIEGIRRVLITYTDQKILDPMYTEEYAKAHGKKSIYSEEALKWLKLTAEEVEYKKIR